MIKRPRHLARATVLLAFAILFSLKNMNLAHATLWSNSYVSFELPPNWECKVEGTEYVCVSKLSKEAKEAIIILAAKEAGPTDTLPAYESKLKGPRMLPDNTGKMAASKVLSVKSRQINGHPWIDALHLGPEINSYYTRYLATIKDRLAILVTFSAHTEHFTKYSSDFLKSVESLRVVAAKDILDSKPVPVGRTNETIGAPISEPAPFEPAGEAPPEPNTDNDMKTKLFALALIVGAIGFYLMRKKKAK